MQSAALPKHCDCPRLHHDGRPANRAFGRPAKAPARPLQLLPRMCLLKPRPRVQRPDAGQHVRAPHSEAPLPQQLPLCQRPLPHARQHGLRASMRQSMLMRNSDKTPRTKKQRRASLGACAPLRGHASLLYMHAYMYQNTQSTARHASLLRRDRDSLYLHRWQGVRAWQPGSVAAGGIVANVPAANIAPAAVSHTRHTYKVQAYI